MNVSQSMLRAFKRYLNGDECGIVFRGRYIDQTYQDGPANEAMAAGVWFEHQVTGATQRNTGYVPEPGRLKNGELNATYKILAGHVDMAKSLIPAGATFGDVIENKTAIFGHVLTGITDVRHPEMLADIKTTAHIDNKWEPFGWGGDAEHISASEQMFQARFYTLIEYLNTGKVLPFYFFIFSSKNEKAKIVKVNQSEYSLQNFLIEVEYLINEIERNELEPVPSFERCRACTIQDCEFRQTMPDVIEVNL